MYSAFGVDHGDFSKREKKDKYRGNDKPSAGRRVTASAFPIPHAVSASKKGHRARSATNVSTRAIGGAGLGAAAGTAAGYGVGTLVGRSGGGRMVTRELGNVGGLLGGAAGGGVGGVAGGHAGIQRGVTINSRKGHYRKEE